MSTLEQALLATELEPFEGKSVRQAGMEAPGMAGGLRDAMRIDPAQYPQGTRIVTIAEHVVQKVRHDPIDTDDPAGDQRRVHILVTEAVAVAGADLVTMVRDQLAAQKAKLALAKAEAKGYPSMVSADELEAAHAAGQHTELMPGCPDCAAELAAQADERPKDMSDDEWEASGTVAGDGTGEALPPVPEGTTAITGRKPRARKRAGS